MTSNVSFAIRSLRKAPAFAIAAILCIAIAVGANTTIFSVVSGVLLRPLPYRDADRLVVLYASKPGVSERNVASPGDFIDWRDRSRSFGVMGIVNRADVPLTDVGDPAMLRLDRVMPEVFQALGVAPRLGRVLESPDAERGAERVVVISEGLWRSRFAARPDAIGTMVTVNGVRARIVGVMPAGFRTVNDEADMWSAFVLPPGIDWRATNGRFVAVVAKLRPDVTREQAQRELDGIAAQVAAEHPDFNAGWGVSVVGMREVLVGDVRKPLAVLMGAVALVLLIACANVANLQLVRATARAQEFAVRGALGAGRGRLARQLLVESLIVAAIGGTLGLLGARTATGVLVRSTPDLPFAADIGIDVRVLAFTTALTMLTGILFGLVPAFGATRLRLSDALRQGGRGTAGGRHRIRGVLAGAQVALSLVLVVGAGLLLRSFANLVDEDPGFRADQVLTARMTPPGRTYRTDSARAVLLMRVVERARTIPGVVEAGGVNLLPIADLGAGTGMVVEGRPAEPVVTDRPSVEVRMATGGYFRAMGHPLRRGTLFRGDEPAADENQIVINETLARQYFAGRDPIGRTVTISWDRERVGRIVGVVGDVRHSSLDSASRPMTYWPVQQMVGFNEMAIVMRLAPGAGAVGEALRRELQAIDPSVPLGDVTMMDVHLAESLARRRLTMSLVSAFGAIAVLLAAVGVYGVIAYGVAQRTREFGLRLALGAQGIDVTRLVVGEGFVLAAASVVVGIAGALALTRVLRSALYEVTPTDPLVFAGAVALLVGVAVLASWLPARRASRVDPAVALRAD